jgi:hypothetical protein
MVCQGFRAHNTSIFAVPLTSSHGGKGSCAAGRFERAGEMDAKMLFR